MNTCNMESLLVCKKENGTRLWFSTNKRNGSNYWARIIGVTCVVLLVLACCSIAIYTHLTFKDMKERLNNMKDEVAEVVNECRLKLLSMEYAASEESAFQDEISETKYRGERSVKKETLTPPFIHLFGKGRTTKFGTVYFTWSKDKLNPGLHGFHLLENDNDCYKIKIKHHGVYLVYAQVAVHGRENVNQPHECAHETVCYRKSEGTKVLLSSLVTQYQLSGAPFQENVHNHWLRALDTTVHMGVFMLHTNDELSVQIPKNCGNMEYSMTANQSYFGIVQLSQIRKPKTPKPPKKIKKSTQKPDDEP